MLIEGEEELSAENLTAFLTANTGSELLRADLALITDCGMYDEHTPGVTTALRGMAAIAFTLRTAASDVHSGVYGGVLPNAVLALAQLLATLRDPESGHILIEGFYDDVLPIPEAERAAWANLPHDDAELAAELGVPRLTGEPEFTALERMWGRPTLDVTGASGGHTGEGLKTIIPAEAHATISCRLVPDQDAEQVLDLLERHLRAHTPAGAALTIDWRLPGCWPVVVSTESPAVGAALAAAEEGFGLPAAVYRAGYSVPIVELFARIAWARVGSAWLHSPGREHARAERVHSPRCVRRRRPYVRGFLDQPLPWPVAPVSTRPAGGSSTCSSSARPSTPASGSVPASPR